MKYLFPPALPTLADPPASGEQGQMYFNTTSLQAEVYDGSVWVPLGQEGPQGPAGVVLVHHADDPTVARPTNVPFVIWRGTVQPDNWDTTVDLWLDETQ